MASCRRPGISLIILLVGSTLVACSPSAIRPEGAQYPATSVVPPELNPAVKPGPSPSPRVFGAPPPAASPAPSPAASPAALLQLPDASVITTVVNESRQPT